MDGKCCAIYRKKIQEIQSGSNESDKIDHDNIKDNFYNDKRVVPWKDVTIINGIHLMTLNICEVKIDRIVAILILLLS